MQNVIIDKPYKFVGPSKSKIWQKGFKYFAPRYLKNSHGISTVNFSGLEKLTKSIYAGHSIMLSPNHCRPCDPMLLSLLTGKVNKSLYIMGSWHLFMQNMLYSTLLPRLGVFSVYREGMDREALKFAIQTLSNNDRMLVLFPEGVVTRTNDRINNLLDGTSFIARSAARQRKKEDGGKVVVHPIGIRYYFEGDIEKAVSPVLERIEQRLTLKTNPQDDLIDRIDNIGFALLSLKELEYFGTPQPGELKERLNSLINKILCPLEDEWLNGKAEGDIVMRVKKLRMAILPDMVAGDISEKEKSRRWKQLEDTYLAQQIYLYPPGYFSPEPTSEQILETVERFEEDLTDEVTIHSPIRAELQIGEAIEVSTERVRGASSDPVMDQIKDQLENMVGRYKFPN